MTVIDAADLATMMAAVRAAPGDAAVVIPAALPPIERALLIAAIAPLAVERAPHRLNALDCGQGVAPAAIEAALTYLASADCTTGQLLALVADE